MSADSPHSSGLPARNRPVLSDLSKQTTEEDLWDLDESDAAETDVGGKADEDQAASPATPRPDFHEVTETAPAKPVVIGKKREKFSLRKSPAPQEIQPSEPTDDFANLDDDTGLSDDGGDPEIPEPSPPASATLDEEPATEGFEQPVAAPAAPATDGTSAPRPRLNRRELIGIGVFSAVLLAAVIWGLAAFFGHLHFTSESANEISFPVKGQRAVVAAAESFWREPIREGPERDAARSDVAMIPVVELTLEPGGDSGALRVLFRNSHGEPVGDTITRTFSGGKFDHNGSERTECASTSGFAEVGEFNAHRAGQSEPWSVLVLEGPGQDAPASQFTTLFETPLSTLRR